MKQKDLYVRSSLEFDGFEAFLERMGGNLSALMKEVGIDRKPPHSKIHFIEWAPLCTLFETAARRYNEPYLGLKWAFGLPEDFRNTGPTMLLLDIASNARHFLTMALEYQKIHTNGVAFSYEENLEAHEVTGIVAIHPLSPSCRQFCEHMMASIAILGRKFVTDFTIKKITFQHRSPDDLTWYNKAFDCPIEFNADRNTIVTDLSYLGLSKETLTTKVIIKALETYLNWEIKKNSHVMTSMSAAVTEILPSLFGVRNSNIESVASALSLHPKKLQRLLSEEDTSFSYILDEVRQNIASRLLMDSDIRILRIATLLDYSSEVSFIAASKRWFQMTPTQYRRTYRDKRRIA